MNKISLDKTVNTSNFMKHSNPNPIQRFLISNFYKSLFQQIEPLSLNSVLDVGCGEGITLRKLEELGIGKQNVGVDYSEDAIKIGKLHHPDLDIRIGNIYDLAFENNSFDAVICTEVLEHLEDPSKAVDELKRVTKKYIIISVPNEPFFIGANLLRGKYLKGFGNHPEHINHWTAWGIENYLRKHNLKVVSTSHPFAWSIVICQK